jgi:hypothetical protein
MLIKSRLTIACLLGLALVLSAGCSSEPKDPFGSWDAAMKHHEFVPASALSVKSGSGVMEFVAPEDGMLYVMDTSKTVQVEGVTKPTVVIHGYLAEGTHVIFDPSQKRIRVKGREGVKLTQVDPSHVHEFRFDSNAQRVAGKSS